MPSFESETRRQRDQPLSSLASPSVKDGRFQTMWVRWPTTSSSGTTPWLLDRPRRSEIVRAVLLDNYNEQPSTGPTRFEVSDVVLFESEEFASTLESDLAQSRLAERFGPRLGRDYLVCLHRGVLFRADSSRDWALAVAVLSYDEH